MFVVWLLLRSLASVDLFMFIIVVVFVADDGTIIFVLSWLLLIKKGKVLFGLMIEIRFYQNSNHQS